MTAIKYPALQHARSLLQRMLKLKNPGPSLHYLFLEGAVIQTRQDSDSELPYAQEPNFRWLSGCDVPGSALTVSYLHGGRSLAVDDSQLTAKLYLPALDEDDVMWSGMPLSPEAMAEKSNVSEVVQGWSKDELYPRSSGDVQVYIHTLPWTEPPAAKMTKSDGPIKTTSVLLKALHEARRNKDSAEVELLKKAQAITKSAHEKLMHAAGSGKIEDENAAEGLFLGECRRLGSKKQAYHPIMASGSAAGTLHYVGNDAPFRISSKHGGGMLLVDAGCELDGYTSDITRCIPLGNGGKFTKECKDIYELVLEMQEEAFPMIKPGANWEDVQLKMHEVVGRGLLKLGILKTPDSLKSASADDVVAKLLESSVTSAFFPHGVGHLLGLDTHDVGGLPEGRSSDPLKRYLRLRVPLEEGFVVTVEPGCYFNEFLLAPHKNSDFINHDVLAQYAYVGGVRIEDNVLVTKDGHQNLTDIAKTVAEVEAITTASS